MVEPDEDVDQPVNVYPVRVGAVGADEILAPVLTEPLETKLPP